MRNSRVPKDVIEEALSIKLPVDVYNEILASANTPNLKTDLSVEKTPSVRMDGLNAIVSAAQRLESVNQAPSTPKLDSLLTSGLESRSSTLQLPSLIDPMKEEK